MSDSPTVYNKVFPVCKAPFQTTSRNRKYCDKPSCYEFAQKRIGKLRRRRRTRDLNRAFHVEWTRRHREDREAYIKAHALILCEGCGHRFHLDQIEVHHKDGNFKNSSPDNLAGLCERCHKKAEAELRAQN